MKKLRDHAGAVARFKPYKANPDKVKGLADTHPAVVEGRTLFPGNVVGPWESARLLVSGQNNSKTGGKVMRGPWAGMPIYTLTLEERATCPRSCATWNTCYGNGMQWPRRNNALHEDFIAALVAEVITVARQHPKGLVLRLHVLGDFFSPAYVRTWRGLMDLLPELHVWGYTARRDDVEESREIALEIEDLNRDFPDRWVVRTSHTEAGPMRTIVVTADPQDPDVIMCPAQIDKTAACATCALCWADGARDKTIGFLLHGIKRGAKHDS